MTLLEPGASPLDAPGTYPNMPGRGLWTLVLSNRLFTLSQRWSTNALGELSRATGRQLVQTWNQPASLTFTLDGHDPVAAAIKELQTDVMAMRWDDQSGNNIPVFHGVVAQSEDQLSEQSHVVTFTCHDYLAMLARRVLTSTYSVVQMDQDDLASALVTRASAMTTSSGVSLSPGSWLAMRTDFFNPDGSLRTAKSGQLRDRTYLGSQQIGSALSDLAAVINGFDFDIVPPTRVLGGIPWVTQGTVRIFYPYQGATRTQPLVYGGTVSAITRTINSADYGNYWRVLGNNGSEDPNAAQLYAEAWNSDANNVGASPIGLWMSTDDAADVTIPSTLQDKANGDLALNGTIVPSYTLTLRPGAYSWGNPNMGDVIPLVIQSGRLNVNTTVRVLGITYDIGDDGEENVSLTVGRPAETLAYLLRQPLQNIAALTRR